MVTTERPDSVSPCVAYTHLSISEYQRNRAGVFRIEPLGSEVWEKPLILSRRHNARLGTRTLELLHVAAAIVRKSAFYSFDNRQRKLASAEQLRVSSSLNECYAIGATTIPAITNPSCP
jgi:hypothetical protein